MRGHITKRGKNSWTIVLSLGNDPSTGKREQKWFSVKGTKRDAERRLAELQHQFDTGIPVDLSKCSVREYLTTWLRDVVVVRNRPRTADSYATIVHKHVIPALGSIQLAKLQPAGVERLEANLLASGLSPNTVHHVHMVLAKALKDAMRKGLVHRNVRQAVEAPSPGCYSEAALGTAWMAGELGVNRPGE